MAEPKRTEIGPLLTAADLAKLLGISRTTAYELMGRIPFHVRIGLGKRQRLRLPRSAFDRWLKAGGDKPDFGTRAKFGAVPMRRTSKRWETARAIVFEFYQVVDRG